MSTKAVLVDFGLSVQMTEDIYYPKDLRGTEVRSWSDKSTYDVLLLCLCCLGSHLELGHRSLGKRLL